MKAAPFRYERPRELATALTLVRDPEAKALAGGQSLVPVMAMRLARPRVLVDLNRIQELDPDRTPRGRADHGGDGPPAHARAAPGTERRGAADRGGAAVRRPSRGAKSRHGRRQRRACRPVGRARAGGGDPEGDDRGAAASTGRGRSRPTSSSPGRSRPRSSPGELLTAIRWPLAQPGDGFAFEEVARRHGDFALCGVAVHVRGARRRRAARVARSGPEARGPRLRRGRGRRPDRGRAGREGRSAVATCTPAPATAAGSSACSWREGWRSAAEAR